MATADGSSGGQLSDTVAKHYNELKESGLDERTKSRIFYLRNFNNWIKSMLIGDFLSRIKRNKGVDHPITVLDLCGGKGGDLLKWKKGNIHSLVLADIAGTSVEQAEKRYAEMKNRNRNERHAAKHFSAQFITADCTKDRLRDMYSDRHLELGLTSCQFSFHYSFESYAQADMMVRNACENLRPGGYFVGTTPDANQLVKRLRASDSMSFGNDVYRVTFHGDEKENLPLFGAKYDFHLEGVVDCPEFLVHFPAFEKIAEKYGMQLILKLPFSDFFKKHVSEHENRGLLGHMQAMEPYPAEEDVSLMAGNEEAYKAAQDYVEALKRQGHNRPKVGTLSEAEWEATTIYMVFAFQKIYENTAPEPPPRTQANIPSTADSEVTGTEDTEVKGTEGTEVTGTEDPEVTGTEVTGTEDTEVTGTEVTGTADTEVTDADDTEVKDTENQDSANTDTVAPESTVSGTKRSHEEEDGAEETSKMPRKDDST